VTPPVSAVLDTPLEAEMVVPVDLENDELEVLAGPEPTPFCGNGPACGIGAP
jgi:hypothetical protein